MTRRKRFGEILMEAGVVDEATLQKALEGQRGTGKRLGQILEEMGGVSERNIAEALACQFGFKTVRGMAKYAFPAEVLALLDGETALEKLVFPLKIEGGVLYLAVVNPLDMETLDRISFRSGLRVVPCVTTPSEILEAVNRHYPKAEAGGGSDWWSMTRNWSDPPCWRPSSGGGIQHHPGRQRRRGAQGCPAASPAPDHLRYGDASHGRLRDVPGPAGQRSYP